MLPILSPNSPTNGVAAMVTGLKFGAGMDVDVAGLCAGRASIQKRATSAENRRTKEEKACEGLTGDRSTWPVDVIERRSQD